MLGIRSLSFAVGAYLSIATTLAIFAGGVVRWMIDRAVAKAHGQTIETESEISPGSLYASGLIAAGGIVGLMGVALKLYETATGKQDLLLFPANNFLHHDWVSVLMFVLCWPDRFITLRGSRSRVERKNSRRSVPVPRRQVEEAASTSLHFAAQTLDSASLTGRARHRRGSIRTAASKACLAP